MLGSCIKLVATILDSPDYKIFPSLQKVLLDRNMHIEILLFPGTLPFSLIYSLLGASLGEGNGTPLWYSCLENSMDGGAWWAAVHGVAKRWTRLSDFFRSFLFLFCRFHIFFPALEDTNDRVLTSLSVVSLSFNFFFIFL